MSTKSISIQIWLSCKYVSFWNLTDFASGKSVPIWNNAAIRLHIMCCFKFQKHVLKKINKVFLPSYKIQYILVKFYLLAWNQLSNV